MNPIRLSFCLLLLLAQAALAPSMQAQSGDCPAGETCQPSDNEVIGISMILPPLAMPLTTYSATMLGTTVAAYYDAGMEAYLYGGGPVGQDNYLGESWAMGNPTAEVRHLPRQVGHAAGGRFQSRVSCRRACRIPTRERNAAAAPPPCRPWTPKRPRSRA